MMATAANSAVPKGKGGRGDLHETVLDALGQRVVTGDIPEGTVLRLAELEAQFEVSRGVVREAVRVLESMQVVRSRRRVGVCVLPQAQWDPYAPRVIRWRLAGPQRLRQLNWINELRSAIEPVAAKLAAQRATPEQCGLLTGAVIGMTASARAGDLETYLQHDQQFHRTVLAGSGNPMFRGLAAAVEELLAGRTHHHLMPTTPDPEAVRLHGVVAAAIQSGDGQGAEDGLQAIVAEAVDALTAQA